jgi:hypothetical protein
MAVDLGESGLLFEESQDLRKPETVPVNRFQPAVHRTDKLEVFRVVQHKPEMRSFQASGRKKMEEAISFRVFEEVERDVFPEFRLHNILGDPFEIPQP